MLIKFTDHHFVEAGCLMLLSREVFEEEKLLLLLHSHLLSRPLGILLLSKLVLGGDGLAELGQRVIIFNIEAFGTRVISHFALFCDT